MPLAFDPAAERARYHQRLAFLADHWAMALEVAPGIRFQPETQASVEDQVRETFWAEGEDPDQASPEALAEMRASFAALSPRREWHGLSVVATLMFGFPDATREARLAALKGFPEQLRLELEDGSLLFPEVDQGFTGGSERLPAVLALRYLLPSGSQVAALLSTHPQVSGRFSAPPAWANWAP